MTPTSAAPTAADPAATNIPRNSVTRLGGTSDRPPCLPRLASGGAGSPRSMISAIRFTAWLKPWP